ncbi:MAG: hypothetical protein ABR866_12520 [Candidatus Korobacteraceae bacterium]|jgi:hypothetical protein
MAIRGKIFVAVLLALTLVALTPAFAGEREKLGDANWTGPLETPNPNTLPKNSFYVETYFVVEQDNGAYDNSGNQHRAKAYDNDYQSVTLFTYGLTNRVNLQLLPAFDGARVAGGGSSGMEVDNLTIRVPIQILKFKEGKTPLSFTITPLVVAPTGAGLDNVWTPGIGLWVQRPFWMPGGRILRVRAAQSFLFPLQNKKLTFGGCTGGAASCVENQGDYYKTQIGMEYSLTKHWVPAWDFYWKYGSGTTQKTTAGALIPGSCSTFSTTPTSSCATFSSFRIDPALEYNFTGNTGIIFGVEMTVSGHNSGSYIAPQIALQWFKQ